MVETIDRKNELTFINPSTLLKNIKAVEGLKENCIYNVFEIESCGIFDLLT